MSLWVLDTDMVSLMAQHHPGVMAMALARPTDSVTVTIVTVQEVFIGRYNKIKQAQQPRKLIAAYSQLESSVNLLRKLPILSYDSLAANQYAVLRPQYRRLSRNDLRIAAITMSRSAILVTANLTDFDQIGALPIEDWSK